jgi:hypothetical protein
MPKERAWSAEEDLVLLKARERGVLYKDVPLNRTIRSMKKRMFRLRYPERLVMPRWSPDEERELVRQFIENDGYVMAITLPGRKLSYIYKKVQQLRKEGKICL